MDGFTTAELLRIASALRTRAEQRDIYADNHMKARSSDATPETNQLRVEVARSLRAAASADRALADKALELSRQALPADPTEVV